MLYQLSYTPRTQSGPVLALPHRRRKAIQADGQDCLGRRTLGKLSAFPGQAAMS